MPELDLSHGLAVLFGAIAPNIVEGCKKAVDGLFVWLNLLIERQTTRAKRKVDQIRDGE